MAIPTSDSKRFQAAAGRAPQAQARLEGQALPLGPGRGLRLAGAGLHRPPQACDARPAALTPVALPAPPAPATAPAEEPGPQVSRLGVKAVEYSYTLSRPEVSAGETIVELNNQGEDPHNLVLEHEGSEDPALEIPATPSVSQASDRFTLSPGAYLLYCSLYKHEAKGMQATLIVSG